MRSELFAAEHQEKQTNSRWTLQNKRLLRAYITPDQPMIARKGAMVAYQGNVAFEHQGSRGIGEFLKKQVTNEDQPLMKVNGHGEVFFASNAANVFMMQLEGHNDALSVNGYSILAFDGSLQWDIKRISNSVGGLVSGAGLFNIELRGAGTAALQCLGEPMVLDCSQTPTFVDPNSAVCWSANLEPALHTAVKVGDFFGRGSGEAIQLRFHGPGFVVVQPA